MITSFTREQVLASKSGIFLIVRQNSSPAKFHSYLKAPSTSSLPTFLTYLYSIYYLTFPLFTASLYPIPATAPKLPSAVNSGAIFSLDKEQVDTFLQFSLQKGAGRYKQMDNQDAKSLLPPEIREALKRKSSRDPASRFTAKLHLLLKYSMKDRSFEERLGCGWVTDDQFRICKSVLCDVMGIKLNTLNVNLRDLNFQQKQRDKDGWTLWTRSGFTRSSSGMANGDQDDAMLQKKHQITGYRPDACYMSNELPFHLGMLTAEMNAQFLFTAQQQWREITDSNAPSFDTQLLIERAALQFKYEHQPDENAREVIKAIVTPNEVPPRLTFSHFCRLLAMFGPPDTIMLKIASLLTCSNNSGNWLTFDTDSGHVHQPPYASFDVNCPNCLVIIRKDKSLDKDRSIEKVYNDPIVPQDPQRKMMYLVDENQKRYSSWEEYFEQHPIDPYPERVGATPYY